MTFPCAGVLTYCLQTYAVVLVRAARCDRVIVRFTADAPARYRADALYSVPIAVVRVAARVGPSVARPAAAADAEATPPADVARGGRRQAGTRPARGAAPRESR